jgi:hypothetical protein
MQLMKAHMTWVVVATILLFLVVISQAMPCRWDVESVFIVLLALSGYAGTVGLVMAHALLREPRYKKPNRYPNPQDIPLPEDAELFPHPGAGTGPQASPSGPPGGAS